MTAAPAAPILIDVVRTVFIVFPAASTRAG